MRVLSTCVIAVALAWSTPAAGQWAAPSGVSVAREVQAPPVHDVLRPQRVTWIDLSSGLLGALIGVLVALAVCDDDPDGSCPVGTPVIGGAIGGAIGVAVGRAVRN